jgi:hypothetical protein
MSRITLTELHAAILAALEADDDFSGWVIDDYNSEIEDYLESRGATVPKKSAILFSWTGDNPIEEKTVQSYDFRARFLVRVLNASPSDQKTRRTELETVYENLIDCLAGKRLSLRIGQVAPEGVEFKLEDREISVLEVRFRTLFDFDIDYER